MNIQKLSKRTYLLIILVLLLPVLFIIYSPVIMAVGVLNGIITLSAIVFAVWFISSIFLGRAASCGYTCPYGALQEVCGDKVLNKKARKRRADYMRYLIFLAFLTVAAYSILNLGRIQGLDLFISQGASILRGAGGLQLAVLIPLSIVSIGTLSIVFGSRAFCRYLCPQGVFLTMGAKLGNKLKIQRLNLTSDAEKCSKCDICNKACPMGIEVSQMVLENSMENANCILCGECSEACPRDVINYSLGKVHNYKQVEGDVDEDSKLERDQILS
jgi:ferredoxin-type protein NapH